MSSSIWTRCGQKTSPLIADPWRVVEDQYTISTRKLVDSDEEHAVLEGLIENQKPPVPMDPGFCGLHFLLSTPFRYPPLQHGSRFATRNQQGIWYGSDAVETALAERAYYNLLLLDGTTADIAYQELRYTVFRAAVATQCGANLAEPPYLEYRARISSKTDYVDSQLLGKEMRTGGVEAIRYFSARDKQDGTNIAVFSPLAFSNKSVNPGQSWSCVVTTSTVEFRRSVIQESRLTFDAAEFHVQGKLPMPAP
jgi:hypothetical protein